MKVGDLVHVRLDCWLRNLGKWAAGPLEIVAIELDPNKWCDHLWVCRPGGRFNRWKIPATDITTSKGNGHGRKARR